MDIVLTGATGYIGSAVLRRLLDDGHTVHAIASSDASVEAVREAGASAERGDLLDATYLTGVLASADGAIHTAAAGDADDARRNDAVITAAIAAYGGNGRPFVLTGGVWTYGDNADIDEDDPAQPLPITGWRVEGERRLLASDVQASVVQPGIVHGRGRRGIVTALLDGPRDDDGALVLIGSGKQHWTTVHVDDLADLYVRVLRTSTGGAYAGVSGVNPTVREIGEAAGAVVAGSAEEARERLGAPFADALLLDQQATGAKARALGWEPTAPTLVELVAAGLPEDR